MITASFSLIHNGDLFTVVYTDGKVVKIKWSSNGQHFPCESLDDLPPDVKAKFDKKISDYEAGIE